jgi:hypothetical protein
LAFGLFLVHRTAAFLRGRWLLRVLRVLRMRVLLGLHLPLLLLLLLVVHLHLVLVLVLLLLVLHLPLLLLHLLLHLHLLLLVLVLLLSLSLLWHRRPRRYICWPRSLPILTHAPVAANRHHRQLKALTMFLKTRVAPDTLFRTALTRIQLVVPPTVVRDVLQHHRRPVHRAPCCEGLERDPRRLADQFSRRRLRKRVDVFKDQLRQSL